MSWLNGLAVGVSLIVVAGALVAVRLFGGGLERLGIVTFGWALGLISLVALGGLRAATLRGLREVLKGQVPELVLRPGLLFLLVIVHLTVLSLDSFTAVRAMQLHEVAVGAVFLAGAWSLVRSLPCVARITPTRYDARRWLHSVLPLSLLAAMQIVN